MPLQWHQLSISFLWMHYITLREFLQMWPKHSLGIKDELLRFSWSNVNVTMTSHPCHSCQLCISETPLGNFITSGTCTAVWLEGNCTCNICSFWIWLCESTFKEVQLWITKAIQVIITQFSDIWTWNKVTNIHKATNNVFIINTTLLFRDIIGTM